MRIYAVPVGDGLLVTLGTFLSPIGPEGMAVKDNWNWSRSDLFFGLPFYHTGLRASYPVSEHWTLTLAGVNGWNSVVDNNAEKSLYGQALYTTDEVVLSLLYFTGVERPEDAPEGRAWRHTFDAHVTWNATEWLSVLAHADGGVEPNDLGTSGWLAEAVYARFRPAEWLYLALREDVFYEIVASDGGRTASSIFWPVTWVSSATATVEVRPHDHVSFKLEGRHDRAAGELFFGGEVEGDGLTTPFVPNRATQTTLTLGATAWF